MIGSEWIGRRVRIAAWDDLEPCFRSAAGFHGLPAEPVGTVVATGDFGAGHEEILVRIAGLSRPFVFDAHQLTPFPEGGGHA